MGDSSLNAAAKGTLGCTCPGGDSCGGFVCGEGRCSHPVESRSLHYHLEVMCDRCGEIVAIVAPLDQAILGPPESDWLLDQIKADRSELRQHPAIVKLIQSARSGQ